MIIGLPPNESAAFMILTPDLIDLTLDRMARAIGGSDRDAGAASVQRLRAIINRAVPEAQSGASVAGALVGTAVALQYPLMELEHFLRGEPCEIHTRQQAEQYLAFVRVHLWKLEPLSRVTPRA